jgi:transcriptional regulator with XRE-family HTH domain
MLTGSQIRAARGLLDWSAQRLADAAGVSLRSIIRAERTSGVPRMRTDTMDAIRLALEQAGIAFIDANASHGAGVRLRRP